MGGEYVEAAAATGPTVDPPLFATTWAALEMTIPGTVAVQVPVRALSDRPNGSPAGKPAAGSMAVPERAPRRTPSWAPPGPEIPGPTGPFENEENWGSQDGPPRPMGSPELPTVGKHLSQRGSASFAAASHGIPNPTWHPQLSPRFLPRQGSVQM